MARTFPVGVVIKARDGLTRPFRKMRGAVRGLEKGLGAVGKLAALGGVTVGVSAVTDGLRESVDQSLEFGRSMGLLQTFLGGNVKRAGELRGEITGIAKDLGRDLPSLTRGMADVVSAFGDSEETAERARIAAQAATAGFTDTATAVSLLSVTTKNYGDTSAKALRTAADLSFQVVKDGQTTFPDLANAMMTIAPAARAAGVSQKELFAVFSTATGVVGKADQVATGYRAALAGLTSPSASLLKVMRRFRKEGIKSGSQLIAKKGFVGALQAIRAQTDGSAESLNKLFPNLRAQGLILALTGAQAGKFSQDLERMQASSGNLAQALDASRKGFNANGAAMAKAKSQAQLLQVQIGDEVAPAFVAAKTGAVAFGAALFRDVAPAFKAIRGDADGLGISVADVVSVVGKLVKGLLAAGVLFKTILSVAGEGIAAGGAIAATLGGGVADALRGGGMAALKRAVAEANVIDRRATERATAKIAGGSRDIQRIGMTMLDEPKSVRVGQWTGGTAGDWQEGPLRGAQAGTGAAKVGGEVVVRFEGAPANMRLAGVNDNGAGVTVSAEVGRRKVGTR